jgi:hypothetical protein
MEDDEVERIGKGILKGYTSLHDGEWIAAIVYLEAAVRQIKGATDAVAKGKTTEGTPEV